MRHSNMSTTAEEECELRRGPWISEEDSKLIHYITAHGEGRWNLLAKSAGLKRTGKSCRLRWLNYLKPDVKRGNLTPQEHLLILELHSKWGNRWSKIAAHMPGRTDNEIKNYWRTRVQKQARQLKLDSNSNKFLEALRRFWMPRLLEEMEQTSSSSHSSFSSASTISETPSSLNISAAMPLSSAQPCKESDKSSSSICLTDSLKVLEQTESLGYKNSLLKDCYHVDISGYDVEDFNQLDISFKGSDEFLESDSQMAKVDWINSEAAVNFWNMDELWEFRK